MSLNKLFQRRNSNQKDRKASLTPEEPSAAEHSCFNSEGSVVNNQDQTQTAMSSESYHVDDKLNSSSGLEVTDENKNSDIQPESDNLKDETCDSVVRSKTHKRCSVPEIRDTNEQVRIKPRSLSLKESGTNLPAQRTRRRKCESESSAFSSTDDEGFEDKVIQLRERDLEKVIGQCVDRLIRESILTAVKNVKVNNIYEDVMKSLSRSASESSESSAGVLETVQQKLHSDSVSEYADLQMMHSFEEEKLEEQDKTEDLMQQKYSEEIPSNIQSENVKIDSKETGLSLKCPSSEKCSEADLTFVDTLEASKKSVESEDCLKSDIDAEADANDSTKSVNHCESSTGIDQNEKTPTDTHTSDSNQMETYVESNKDSIKNKVLQETVACEQAKEVEEYQGNSDPTENLEYSKQNEPGEDTVDCSRVKKVHVPLNEVKEIKVELVDETDDCKIDTEEIQDISVDGYNADIEESISLHSIASESSLENVKDTKVDSKTIPTETIDTTNEGKLSKHLDATVNKDTVETQETQLDVEEVPKSLNVEVNLMAMSGDDFSQLLTTNESTIEEPSTSTTDLGENLPEQKPAEEEKKVNWKVGYLHVKLPHKSRHKGLKVWKKRCVAIQPDEFSSDDSDPCLVLSVYSGDSSAAKKHSASFWKSISCQKAVIYRSSSRTHPYSFTISDDKKPVIHLSADSEAISQEWMAAIRAILWPPSPVVQLEKMLNGREFEISIIDNEFSYHAGLLGMYGYLTITPKKLILVHPQQGYVIQEWYLNTIDKFQLIPQTRIEDVNKVLSMTTCSDSSTGKGDILIFCKEAVSMLQSVASTIHQILTHHSVQEGGKYQKELEEIGAWLVTDSNEQEDYYKVPPRQVKSLLDIPNFIFNKPIIPIATVAGTPGVPMGSSKPTLDTPKADPTRGSQDSGISAETVSDDFLNCSTTSFKVGGGTFPGKSSDSELSDAYTPPRSPIGKTRREAEASEAITKT